MRILSVREEHIPEMWDHFQGYEYILCLDDKEFNDEMFEWANTTLGEWSYQGKKSAWFKDKADAIEFKLKWS